MPRRPKQLFVQRRDQPYPQTDGFSVSSCEFVTSAFSEKIEVGSAQFQRFAKPQSPGTFQGHYRFNGVLVLARDNEKDRSGTGL